MRVFKKLAESIAPITLASIILFTPVAVAGGVLYSVTDLGTLGGTSSEADGINSRGQVVGRSSTNLSGVAIGHAFLFSRGTMTDLGTLGGSNSSAFGVNNYGQVVGFGNTS